MEKNVKIQLPKRYSVGIEVMSPIRINQAIVTFQTFMSALSEIIGNRCRNATDFEQVLREGGKSLISIPLIHSIAEMKMECLNHAFDVYGIPLKAYLEQED